MNGAIIIGEWLLVIGYWLLVVTNNQSPFTNHHSPITTMEDFKIEYDLKHAATIHNVLGYFKEINTFVFDVDGVMTDGKLFVTEGGDVVRNYNAKDGYAIRREIGRAHV